MDLRYGVLNVWRSLRRCTPGFVRCKKSSKYKHNTMIYGELGRFPVRILITLRMINFWYRIISGKKSKISYILYNILLNLDRKDRFTSP